jgi:ABC-type nitrate/sulfonate/bicarbonate transport system permease component
MKRGLATVVSTGVLLVGWQLIAMFAGQPEIIPSVFRLLQTLAALFASGSFYLSAGATLARGIAGILLSLAIALAAAGLLARFNRLYDLFRPLLAIMRSTPVISFILLALIFLHAESIPLLTGFLTMFPLLTENLIKGIRALRPGLALMAKPFGITGRNYVTQIIYPQLKPFLYSGLASAAGFGWRAIVMGEALSQCRFGIGSEMKQAQAFIAVPELLAWTTVAVLIGFLADKGINRLSACHIPAAYPSKSPEVVKPEGLPVKLTGVSYIYAV